MPPYCRGITLFAERDRRDATFLSPATDEATCCRCQWGDNTLQNDKKGDNNRERDQPSICCISTSLTLRKRSEAKMKSFSRSLVEV